MAASPAPPVTAVTSGTAALAGWGSGRAMAPSLPSLENQVVVITGASSGIGLVTARMAAKRGASLVLAARNDGALEELAEEIRPAGGQAMAVGADVGDEGDVARIAERALAHFGRFDTWVNNGGFDFRAHRGGLDRRHAADVRHGLLGRRLRLPAGRRALQAPRHAGR